MQKRLECQIFGRVQLVMFRDFVTRKARARGVVGTVRNNQDGSVSVIAEGGEMKLRELLDLIRRGPILSGLSLLARSAGKNRETADRPEGVADHEGACARVDLALGRPQSRAGGGGAAALLTRLDGVLPPGRNAPRARARRSMDSASTARADRQTV